MIVCIPYHCENKAHNNNNHQTFSHFKTVKQS